MQRHRGAYGYFSGELPADHKEAANYKRLGIPEGAYEWGAHYDRFDLGKEPNEANRFGWVVEVDVNDPTSTPKKRSTTPTIGSSSSPRWSATTRSGSSVSTL